MDKKEIEKLIEEEKAQMRLFLKISKNLKLSPDEIERQTDFYLDRISELKKLYNNPKK